MTAKAALDAGIARRNASIKRGLSSHAEFARQKDCAGGIVLLKLIHSVRKKHPLLFSCIALRKNNQFE